MFNKTFAEGFWRGWPWRFGRWKRRGRAAKPAQCSVSGMEVVLTRITAAFDS